MITLSNGHSFEYRAESGALAFDGKGWAWEKPLRLLGLIDPYVFTAVTKTLTFLPEKGNFRWYKPIESIRLIRDGVANANGLSNPGVEWWCRSIGPFVNSRRLPLMVSVTGSIEELRRMAGLLDRFDIVGIEYNPSCPNAKGGLLTSVSQIVESCREIKKHSRLPVVLKLSVAHDVRPIISGVDGVVEAISINSVPWEIVFPNRISPLARFGAGGVSGKVAQLYTWGLLKKLKELTDVPVIGPSVWNYEDIEELRKIGADAIGFGSIFLRFPWRPTQFVRKDLRSKS